MSIRSSALATIIGGLLGWGAVYHAIEAEWLAAGIEAVAVLCFFLYMRADHWRVMDLLSQRWSK